MHNTWALVPVKGFTRAKQRLAPVLSEQLRSELFAALVEDLLDVLLATPELAGVLVVSAITAVKSRHQILILSPKPGPG